MKSDVRLEKQADRELVAGKLTKELRERKHIAAGSRVIRGCICEDYYADSLELHIPRLCRAAYCL